MSAECNKLGNTFRIWLHYWLVFFLELSLEDAYSPLYINQHFLFFISNIHVLWRRYTVSNQWGFILHVNVTKQTSYACFYADSELVHQHTHPSMLYGKWSSSWSSIDTFMGIWQLPVTTFERNPVHKKYTWIEPLTNRRFTWRLTCLPTYWLATTKSGLFGSCLW